MTATIATAEPGVRLVRSKSGGPYHVIRNHGTPFAYCESCGAARVGRDCWAVVAAIEDALEEIPEEKDMAEVTRAVAVAERRETVVRQQAVAMAAKAALGGWNDLVELGKAHIKTGFAPKDVDTPEKAGLILLKALEMDIPITSAYEFVAVINGRPKLMGQMVSALVNRSGKGSIDIVETSNERAVAEGRRGDRKVRIAFTIQDAAKANLLKNPTWNAYPADMLRWKAVARVGRFMFADVLGGMDVVGVEFSDLDSVDVTTDEGAPVEHVEIIEGESRVIPDEPPAPTRPVDTETGEIEGESPTQIMKRYGISYGKVATFMGRSTSPGTFDADVIGYANEYGTTPEHVIAAAAGKPLTAGAGEGEPEVDYEAFYDDLMAANEAAGLMPIHLATYLECQNDPEQLYAAMTARGLDIDGLVAAVKGGQR